MSGPSTPTELNCHTPLAGYLAKKGNSWHLLEEIVADVSQIMNYFENHTDAMTLES